MRKKKMSTMQPEVEAKEVIIEEAVVQEAENKAPEEITEEQGEKKAGEEKPVPKRKKRAVKEKTTTVEAPKKRGRNRTGSFRYGREICGREGRRKDSTAVFWKRDFYE